MTTVFQYCPAEHLEDQVFTFHPSHTDAVVDFTFDVATGLLEEVK